MFGIEAVAAVVHIYQLPFLVITAIVVPKLKLGIVACATPRRLYGSVTGGSHYFVSIAIYCFELEYLVVLTVGTVLAYFSTVTVAVHLHHFVGQLTFERVATILQRQIAPAAAWVGFGKAIGKSINHSVGNERTTRNKLVSVALCFGGVERTVVIACVSTLPVAQQIHKISLVKSAGGSISSSWLAHREYNAVRRSSGAVTLIGKAPRTN